MSQKYFLHVLGCQMNTADAQRISGVLTATGWQHTEKIESADAYIFVTCSVKQKAEDKVFGHSKSLAAWKKEKPGRVVALTGCMARKTSTRRTESADPLFEKMKILDTVFRIEDTAALPDLLGSHSPKAPVDEQYYKDYFSIPPRLKKGAAQVFIPISKGCDNWCSFCIVPLTRRREHSRPKKDILEEAKEHIKNGAIEITLLGQNVDSYKKSSHAFADLLDSVAKLPGLKRLRFTSSHPKDMVQEVMQVMARHENIERHLHFASQHGDNEVLHRMNRGYSAETFLEKVEQFRSILPGASVTTDIIVGFPGETDAAFKRLVKFYKKAAFEFAFISRYSQRKGTLAEKQYADDIPPEVKAARWHEMNMLLRSVTGKRYKKCIGTTLEVLIESWHEGVGIGRSSELFLVKALCPKSAVGSIIPVHIKNARDTELLGQMA